MHHPLLLLLGELAGLLAIIVGCIIELRRIASHYETCEYCHGRGCCWCDGKGEVEVITTTTKGAS